MPTFSTVDFTLKGYKGKQVNDVPYPISFQLENRIHTFKITPKSKYWRFGLKLSKTTVVQFDTNERYNFQDYKFLQLSVGRILSESNRTEPNVIELGNMQEGHPFDLKSNYVEQSDVEFKIFYNAFEDLVYISYSTDYFLPFVKVLPWKDYKYFQIFAWADWMDFEIDVKVETEVIDDNAQLSAMRIGNIVFRFGDMFDYDAIQNSNLILLPCSSEGSVNPNINNRIIELGIPRPFPKPAGSIYIYEVAVYKNSLFAGYAYSVDDYISSEEIIAKICKAIVTELTNTETLNPNIYGINLPLLGTGAGGLQPTKVVATYDSEFNKKKLRNLFIVSVQSNEVFQQIKTHFQNRYFPFRLDFQNEKPEDVMSLESELGVILANHNYKVNKRGKLTELNLGGFKIKDITILGRLTDLRFLTLDDNPIEDYQALYRLKKLHTLYIRGNLRNDYSFINELQSLKSLGLSHNSIADLSFLSKNRKLESLDLANNKINDISVLSTLKNLEYLSLQNNQVRDVSPLSALKNLINLNLSGNNISRIISIRSLKKLNLLDISRNKVENVESIGALPNLFYLKADVNPFVERNNIILSDSENHLYPVQNMLLRLAEKGRVRINLPAKVLLLGNHASGKSSLLEYIQNSRLVQNHSSTHIIKIEKYPFKTTKIPKAIFFDFGGQDYYHGIYRAFLTAGSIYLLLWNSQQSSNKPRVDSTGYVTQDFSLDYWLAQKKYLENEKFGGEHDPVLLIQTFSDKYARINTVLDTNEIIANEFYISLQRDSFSEKNASKHKVNKQGLIYLKESIFELIEEKSVPKDEPRWYVNFLKYILHQNSVSNYKPKSVSREIIKFYRRKHPDKLELLKEDLDQLHKQGLILYYRDEHPDKAWLNPVALVKYIHTKILNKKIIGKWHGRIPYNILEKNNSAILDFLCKQKVIFKDEYNKEFITPNFLQLVTETKTDFDLFTFEMGNPVFVLKFKNFLPFGLINQLTGFFGKLPERKKFWRDQFLFILNEKTKVLIHLDFSFLEVKVYASFLKDVAGNDKSDVAEYLFYAIISIYWDFEPLEFTDFISFRKKAITKETFQPDHPMFQKISNSERIYEKEDCRPLDLFISFDDKHFVNYANLCSSSDSDIFINGSLIDESRNLTSVSKSLPIYPFQIFTNKRFNKMKRIFISYSKLDLPYINKFTDHLSGLKYDGKVATWYCTELTAGSDWDTEIQDHFDQSDIVCFMISPNFMKTKYIREYEIKKAFEKKNKRADFMIVPIILDFCRWQTELNNLADFTGLPYTAKPIADFENQNMAWYIIIEVLRIMIEKNIQPSKDDWVEKNLPDDVRKIFERIALGKT